MRLVGSVAAQPSTRNPHEIEGSSVGQPQVKWRKERILGAGGQENRSISGSPTTHRHPEPRQHWRDGQKKAQPIRVRLFKLVACSLLPNDLLLEPVSTGACFCNRSPEGFALQEVIETSGNSRRICFITTGQVRGKPEVVPQRILAA